MFCFILIFIILHLNFAKEIEYQTKQNDLNKFYLNFCLNFDGCLEAISETKIINDSCVFV